MSTTATAGEPDEGDRVEAQLRNSAARWMADALDAWAEDDYAKVAILAPLAVELLGKATLWRENPVLLVPLSPQAESSLFSLASKPSLDSPKLRTVGLTVLLNRLEQLLGSLPIDQKRRTRLVEIRNGAMHVGTPAQSRHVLMDCLAVCMPLLKHLNAEPDSFYGSHYSNALGLLDENRSEVGHRVASKKARARLRLQILEDRLGDELFKETTDRMELLAADELDHDPFATGLWAVPMTCPECGSRGRLHGHVDADPDVDVEAEHLGGGQYEYHPYLAGWNVEMRPREFSCNVCRLTLTGSGELGEAGLPNSRFEVEARELGDDFDPELLYQSERD